MEYIINEELIPMIDDGTLNITKIHCLASIKEFIDRVSTTHYVKDNVVNNVAAVYHAKPAVITWGDYFQSKLAYELQGSSDSEFIKAVDTVKFDIMSSFEIFDGKNKMFYDWVDNNLNEIESSRNNFTKEELEEAVHLKILMDYFTNMKIADNFSNEEKYWYNNFKEAVAV